MPLNSQVPGWLKTPGYHLPSGLVVTTLGSMPLGQLLQRCGPTEAGDTVRKGGYVTPSMGVNLSPRPRVGSVNTGRGWPLGGEHGGDTRVRRQRPEKAAAGPGTLQITATPSHPHINHPVSSNAESWPQTQSEDSQ